MAPSSPNDKARPRWRSLGTVQIAVVVVLVLVALVYARAPRQDSAAGAPDFAGAPNFVGGRGETPPPVVRVVRPAATRTALRIAATGSVDVRNHVALAPQVGGRVVEVSESLRAGGAFHDGEQLLVIDRRDFELAFDQAEAEVATAAATVLLREAEGEAAQANYALLNPGEVVPALVAKTPQIAQAKARLAAARARLKVAALELERTAFSLPFAGRVTETSAEVGQVLGRGQAFGQAYALDALEVVAPLSADDVERLAPVVGRRARVRAGGRALPARVERVSAELDARSRFATLYLTFAEDAKGPPPGTFVDLTIDGPELPNTYVLPEAAEQVGGSVWLVAGGQLQSFTPTALGRTAEGWVVAAFDAKDGVVTGAVPGARGGLKVQVGAGGES